MSKDYGAKAIKDRKQEIEDVKKKEKSGDTGFGTSGFGNSKDVPVKEP